MPVFSCPPRSSTQPLSLAFLLSQPQLPSGATPSIHQHLMILLAGRCSAWPVRLRSSSLSRLRSNLPARSLPTPSQPPRPSSPRATTSSPGSPPPLQGPPPHRVIRARPTRTQIQIRSFSRFVKSYKNSLNATLANFSLGSLGFSRLMTEREMTRMIGLRNVCIQ